MTRRFRAIVFVFLIFCSVVVRAADFYVSPDGSDAGPGTEALPFATLDRARLAVRARIAAGLTADVEVQLRGGTYRITSPVVLGPPDSPPAGRRVTYAAYPGEQPVVSGGRLIEGWADNGNGSWSVTIPQVVSEQWHFRELFVNGRRRERARHPNSGFLLVAGPDAAGGPNNRTSFVFDFGDLPLNSNLAGAEIVFLHDWCISRVQVAQANHSTRVLTMAQPIGATGLIQSIFQTDDHPRYFIENHAALLNAPGEWHLNRTTGVLTYRPMPGEFMPTAEVVAPKATELVVVRGEFNSGVPVRNIRFDGISFEHCAWGLPAGGYAEYQAGYYEWRVTSTPYTLPAALTFEVTDGCSVENARVAHCGGWGILFGAWCRNGTIRGNVIDDMAGNGILVGEDRYRVVPGGQWWQARPDQVAVNNLVDSNLVQDCGRTLYGCVGIWSGLTDGTVISRNRVRRLPWTGVSAGGLWNDTPSPCRETQITSNHIHDVMQLLSDGAGVYSVGLQPDSKISGNRIHDIPPNYGVSDSNGIYCDQGSTGFSVEDNGIFNVFKAPFRFHLAGVNSVTSNVVMLSSEFLPAIRFQNMNPALVNFSGNTIFSPLAPPPCDDPVCDEAISAGIADPFAATIFADGDGDGTADIDDPCPLRLPGDANGDGEVNGLDVTVFVQVLLGATQSSDEYCACDLTGDGLANMADVGPLALRLTLE